MDDNIDAAAAAAFIAARLQHPCPHINGCGNPWVSTIRVDQYKQKFGHVYVYCELADPSLVAQKWAWLKANAGHRARLPAGYTMCIDMSSDALTPEFVTRCVLRDAMHYRDTYLEISALAPRLCGQLQWHASYRALLHADLDTCLRAVAEETASRPQLVAAERLKYRLDEHDDLDAFMRSVYQPTTRERVALMG